MTDFMPPGQGNQTPGSVPPPPPPASDGNYQPTAPIPEYQPITPIPGYPPTTPLPEYQQAAPATEFQHTGPAPTYPQAAPYQTTAPYQPNAPQLGIDNTGVPTLSLNSTAQASTTFLKALFDMSFRTFITRKLATVIYGIGLAVIAISAILMLLSGLATGFAALSYSSTFGFLSIFGSLIGVPLGALVFAIILRLTLEAGVALIAVAENTEQTAVNTASE